MFYHIFWGIFRHSLSANNPEEFELLNVRIVQWRTGQSIVTCDSNNEVTTCNDAYIILRCFHVFLFLFMVLQNMGTLPWYFGIKVLVWYLVIKKDVT